MAPEPQNRAATEYTRALAERMPDMPWSVEIRTILREKGGEILALDDAWPDLLEPDVYVHDLLSFALWERESRTFFVVGDPSPDVIARALASAEPGTKVIVPRLTERFSLRLRYWDIPVAHAARLIVYLLSDNPTLPDASEGEVAFLDPALLRTFTIPDKLLEELESRTKYSPLVASFVGGQPVSFCYARAITEQFWDVSVETLPDYRRQGHAGRAAAFLIRHMQGQGKLAVWQARDDNPDAMRLAEKLGFVPVDDLLYFELE